MTLCSGYWVATLDLVVVCGVHVPSAELMQLFGVVMLVCLNGEVLDPLRTRSVRE